MTPTCLFCREPISQEHDPAVCLLEWQALLEHVRRLNERLQ